MKFFTLLVFATLSLAATAQVDTVKAVKRAEAKKAMKDKWNTMTPEEKAKAKEKFLDKRKAVKEKWDAMTPEEKAKAKEKVKEAKEKIKEMTPEEKAEIRKKIRARKS